jgi:hypothetical protein
MRSVLCAVLSLFLLESSITFAGTPSGATFSSPKIVRVSSKSSKTVHVRGYYRKDGTYVQPYDRSTPGTNPRSSSGASRTSVSPSPGNTTRNTSTSSTVQRDANGKIKRSAVAKDAFKKQHPCPANGHTSGACPGYVIDHVSPLECGGADDPSNMQWQTVAEGKAKDKTEGLCKR